MGQREAALQVCPAPLAPGRGTTKVFIHHRPATGYMAARRNTLCAHNPAVLFIRQKIKVAQRIVADGSSCKWFGGSNLPPRFNCCGLGEQICFNPSPANCPLWVELWRFLGFTRPGGGRWGEITCSPFNVGLKQFAPTRLGGIQLDLIFRVLQKINSPSDLFNQTLG